MRIITNNSAERIMAKLITAVFKEVNLKTFRTKIPMQVKMKLLTIQLLSKNSHIQVTPIPKIKLINYETLKGILFLMKIPVKRILFLVRKRH